MNYHNRTKHLIRSAAGVGLLTACALALPGSALADGITSTQSSMPAASFYASLPTNVNTNVPAGGSFDASGCSITIPASVQHAMVPGEVYWGRCANGLYVTASSTAPATTWFAPAPGARARMTHVTSTHTLWKLAQRAHQRVDLVVARD